MGVARNFDWGPVTRGGGNEAPQSAFAEGWGFTPSQDDYGVWGSSRVPPATGIVARN